jgi:hypothetical protein
VQADAVPLSAKPREADAVDAEEHARFGDVWMRQRSPAADRPALV